MMQLPGMRTGRWARRAVVLLATTLFLMLPAASVPASGGDPAGIGVVDPSTGRWYLQDPVSAATTSFYYGNPGDLPFMGDWNCDGVDTPGLYRQSDGYVYLRNSNSQGITDVSFFFGNPGDIPVSGDFDGDGCDTVSIYRPADTRFYIINRLGSADGGLGVAIFSYDGQLCWGLNADFDLVPDLPRFTEALRESFAALSKAAARHASTLTSVQAS